MHFWDEKALYFSFKRRFTQTKVLTLKKLSKEIKHWITEFTNAIFKFCHFIICNFFILINYLCVFSSNKLTVISLVRKLPMKIKSTFLEHIFRSLVIIKAPRELIKEILYTSGTRPASPAGGIRFLIFLLLVPAEIPVSHWLVNHSASPAGGIRLIIFLLVPAVYFGPIFGF